MTNARDDFAPRKRGLSFWLLAPLTALIMVILPVVYAVSPTRTVSASTIALFATIELAGVCVILGLWDPRRFHVCLRALGLLVFLLYGWYFVDEYWIQGKPFPMKLSLIF